MNPTHLRTFLAVARYANFTRAAESLYLTQPAVSRQIDQLEQDLGVTLFEQLGKSTHLTPAGHTLKKESERLLGAMDRVAESVRAHGSPEKGRIAIGASSTPGLYLLPAIVGRFCDRFPEVELHYAVKNSRRIEHRVLSNDLDLGFIGVAPTDKAIVARKLLEDRIVVFASPSHSVAARREIELKQLAEATWIVREQGAATRELVERKLARAKIKPLRVIEMNCPEGVKALVAAGVGISYMSVHGLVNEVELKQLRIAKVVDFDIRRPIYAIRHRDKHVSPPMKEFERLAVAMLFEEANRNRRQC
jgi:DNA-binding transcriptional LysR family regulator